MPDTSEAYDDLPYESCSYPQSHLGNLAAVAMLFGMKPRGIDSARVLEIGCASGGNLLPLAAAFPGSYFAGIDFSMNQITEAQAGADALRLENVEFFAADIESLDETMGSFDYIIAHGVYSWVAEPLREKLLSLCSKWLKPMGVAYVSYNTFPGSGARMELREMAKFRTKNAGSISEKVQKTRAFFSFLQTALGARSDLHAQALSDELAQISNAEDFYIAHEYLEGTNEPCYFHEFAGHAGQHGLQFLAEAEIQSMSAADLSAEARAGLRSISSSILDSEQYGDFLRNRAFRQTLLCHSSVELKRAILPDLVQQFHLSSSLAQAADTAQFSDSHGVTIQVGDPLTKAALQELQAVWPNSIHFPELLNKAAARAQVPAHSKQAQALAGSLLTCFSNSKAVQFQPLPQAFINGVSDQPTASALSRWQSTRGARVTNQRHENIILGPSERALLRELGGKRNLKDLVGEFPNAMATLEKFAAAGLLTA